MPDIVVSQSKLGVSDPGPEATYSLSFTTTPTVGRMVLVLAGAQGSDHTSMTCSDNQGNTYTACGSPLVVDTRVMRAFTAPIDTASGTFTVTVETTGGTTDDYWGVFILEIDGEAASGFVEQYFTTNQYIDYTPFTVGLNDTTVDGSLVACMTVLSGGNTLAGDTGWTTTSYGSLGWGIHKVASTAGAHDPTYTNSGTGTTMYSVAVIIKATATIPAVKPFQSNGFQVGGYVLGGGGGVTLVATLFSEADTLNKTYTLNRGTVTLTATRFNNSPTLNKTHTLNRGTVTLTATRFNNSPAFKSHTLSVGAVALVATRFNNSPAFKSHTLNRGAVALAATLFSDADTLNKSHTLTQGPLVLVATLFSDGDTLNKTHTLTRGTVTLAATLFSDADILNKSHTLTAAGGPQTLTAARFDNSPTFKSHTLNRGAVALAATRFDDSDVLNKTHTLNRGTVTLVTTRFNNSPTFKSHTLNRGTVTLVATRFNGVNVLNKVHVLNQVGGPISLVQASRFDDSDTFFSHVLTGGQQGAAGAAALLRRRRRELAPS